MFPINLAQRVIVWLGCNSLIWLWIHPPVYLVQPNGTRLEHNIAYLWEISDEWSVNIPLVVVRIVLVLLVTLGLCFVFKTNAAKGGAR